MILSLSATRLTYPQSASADKKVSDLQEVCRHGSLVCGMALNVAAATQGILNFRVPTPPQAFVQAEDLALLVGVRKCGHWIS